MYTTIYGAFRQELDENDDFGTQEINEAKRAKGNNLTTKYRELIHFARQEEDFTDVEIEEF